MRCLSSTEQLRWIRSPILSVDDYTDTLLNNLTRRRKFIFEFSFSEQLGHGTVDLLVLCSLAKNGE